MIAALDVAYDDEHHGYVAAAVLFEGWASGTPLEEVVVSGSQDEPYRAGELFRRELPALLAVLEALKARPAVVIVDGYVWLGDEGRPGLGGHLFRALGGSVAVVGVAKNPLFNGRPSQEVLRGTSRKPLFVSATGMDLELAASEMRAMHGEHRIPTFLGRVDVLSKKPWLSRAAIAGVDSP